MMMEDFVVAKKIVVVKLFMCLVQEVFFRSETLGDDEFLMELTPPPLLLRETKKSSCVNSAFVATLQLDR